MSTPSLVEDVFLAALEKGTPKERAAYLDEACKDNPDLRRRVDRLLQAHPKAGDFLEPPVRAAGEETGAFASAEGGTAAHTPAAEQAGVVLAGRYKLIEPIGEGGMGSVWMAQQTEPVKRLVAVKLIKAGMDSRAVLARFEAERQALALMDHPHIAKVLDAGAAPDGRPFFVMEVVKGIPITTFCDERKLTPRGRLELFVPVCQAIQHAHQKGVIHRDLKPSNVLVALYDDKAVPKVIDFGVAKAAGQPLTEKTLATGFGTVVGTPEYMSPEQASFNNLDIDTRSDVYALGVLLYELLTGSPPFSHRDLEKAGLLEMLRVVREVEPPKPSTRLSTADALPTLSANRGTEPSRLTRLVRGELDWIVMKALEKERSCRYDTATGFAADVQRYLAGEPVQAVPPSAAYRVRKFVRKHRVAVTTAAAFALVLVAAAGVSSWLAVKATRAEAAAETRRQEAEAEARRADENASMHLKAVTVAETLRQSEANATANLRVDRELPGWSNRDGLLRLCRALRDLPAASAESTIEVQGHKVVVPLGKIAEERQTLREFMIAAALSTGQQFAPLLPPITHDGQPVEDAWLSPDGQTVLTLDTDFTARLWDARTARQIALLRKGDERVVHCGFSPDGRTVFTDDKTSIARFWDVPGRKFLAQTEPRPNRYDDSAWPPPVAAGSPPWQEWKWKWPGPLVKAALGNGRLLTQNLWQQELKGENGGVEIVKRALSPCELWDTTTGRMVARLEGASHGFLAGDMVATYESPSTVRVYSADDGRLLARLNHPDPGPGQVREVIANPSGSRIVTVFGPDAGKKILRVWDTASWRELSRSEPTHSGLLPSFGARFVTDDMIALESCADLIVADGFARDVYRCERDGRLTLITDARNYPPDLYVSTMDGRFGVDLNHNLHEVSDHRAHRSFGAGDFMTRYTHSNQGPRDWGNLPGLGLVSPVKRDGGRYQLWLVPSSDRLDISTDLLELWAQVAVRGEIGPDGEFLKWDEPTWEKKRQELAAKPVPHPDFPFPGHVATDKLHWLRAEYGYGEAKPDADRLRVARELLRRSEAAGDRAEAVWWRTVLAVKADPSAPKK